MAATHETARLRSEEREQDLSRKFAEMEEQYSRQLRDQQEELEGRLADVATRWRSSARASAADTVTRAVLDMIHGRLRTAWRTWTSRVKTASVAEIKEQHAMEMAALRDATRVEAANERTRRVIRRWIASHVELETRAKRLRRKYLRFARAEHPRQGPVV